MYWTWFLIACYLTTALAEAPLPHQRVSFGGVRGPSQQTLNLHIHCRDIEIVNTPPSNPNAPPTSSVLRRPARRASIPLQPKPYITAICRAKDGKERRTTLALNYCLGWQQKQGGALIPQDTGYGIQKGACADCKYTVQALGFDISCACNEARTFRDVDKRPNSRFFRRQSSFRHFSTPGVIVFDSERGGLRCFNNMGNVDLPRQPPPRPPRPPAYQLPGNLRSL